MKKKFSWLVVFLSVLLTQLAFAAEAPPQSSPPHVSASKAAPAQRIHRCTEPDGSLTYTDKPCPGEGQHIGNKEAASSPSPSPQQPLAEPLPPTDPQEALLPPECQGWQKELDLRIEALSRTDFAPTAPAYLAWLQERIDACKRRQRGDVGENRDNDAPGKDGAPRNKLPSGAIPSPIDWPHRRKNPPRPVETDRAPDREILPPSSWDLRSWNWLPPVRNQNPFGTCWAHTAQGAAESNAISQGFDNMIIQQYA